jgi:hypothetical protein
MRKNVRWALGLALCCAAPACVLSTESVPGPGPWEAVDEGVSYVGGFVGINTLAPQHPLEVVGDAKAQRFRIDEDAYLAANGTDNIALYSAGKARLTAKADGTVLVSESDAVNDLEVVGHAALTSLTVSGVCVGPCTSDVRLKTNVAPLDGALARLLRLRGVTFDWKDPEAHGERERGTQTGFLAQEVEAEFPEWVTDGKDGYKRLHIRGFEALAVEALRSIDRHGRALAARVTALEEANARLAAEARAARESSARVAGMAAELAAERSARVKLEARLAALEAALQNPRAP